MCARPATAAADAGGCTSQPSLARPLRRASAVRRGFSAHPKRIGAAHPSNQSADLGANTGPTASGPTLPRPVASELLPVPADHRLRPYHLQRMPPTRPQPRQHNPEDSIHLRQPRPWLARLPHGKLLPQRPVLQRQLALGANRASQCPKEDSEPSDHNRPNSGSVRRLQADRAGRLFRRDR